MADIVQGSFVRKVDNASHWINLYPVDNSIDFPNTVEPRLSGFLDYPDFFSGPNLVMNIYKSRSRSVAISFLKLQH